MTERATADALPAPGGVIPATETANHAFGQCLPDLAFERPDPSLMTGEAFSRAISAWIGSSRRRVGVSLDQVWERVLDLKHQRARS
jgi:hypothetical protein